MTDHAIFSPSGAHRWVPCPGSYVLTKDLPRTSSSYADEGTAAHTLAAKTLLSKSKQTTDFIGEVDQDTGYTYDREMCGYVQTYVDLVLDYARDGELLVEQRVDFSDPIGAPNGTAFGTSDVVILRDDEITVMDLKYGRGVAVSAVDNPQLQLYALGAAHQYGMIFPVARVRMVIVQPRTDVVVSEDTMSFAELTQKGESFSNSVVVIKTFLDGVEMSPTEHLNPSEKQCRFCGAKANCPAIAEQVKNELSQDFADFDDLICDEPSPEALDMVEDWLRAKRADVERRLLANEPLTKWKLVAGRKGNRQWRDANEAEQTMKAMRLKADEMYTKTLITAPQAEKILGDKPRCWGRLEKLITRTDGKPTVVPVNDKRPALVITPVIDDFVDVSANVQKPH